MLEVAYILVALALIVFLVYLIITVQKLGRVIDETEKTIKTLTSDVDVTLHHTNELLAKVNVLADDINVKVATIDPLFSAVADLSLCLEQESFISWFKNTQDWCKFVSSSSCK